MWKYCPSAYMLPNPKKNQHLILSFKYYCCCYYYSGYQTIWQAFPREKEKHSLRRRAQLRFSPQPTKQKFEEHSSIWRKAGHMNSTLDYYTWLNCLMGFKGCISPALCSRMWDFTVFGAPGTSSGVDGAATPHGWLSLLAICCSKSPPHTHTHTQILVAVF